MSFDRKKKKKQKYLSIYIKKKNKNIYYIKNLKINPNYGRMNIKKKKFFFFYPNKNK